MKREQRTLFIVATEVGSNLILTDRRVSLTSMRSLPSSSDSRRAFVLIAKSGNIARFRSLSYSREKRRGQTTFEFNFGGETDLVVSTKAGGNRY